MADSGIVSNLDCSHKFLLLDGYGVSINIDDGKLIIRDGTGSNKIFFPKRFPFDNIIIYGTRGSITFEAIRWIIKHNAQISVINWNGKLLTSILPPESKQTKLKFRQYEISQTSERIKISKRLIEAKFDGTKNVLNLLKKRYPKVDNNIEKVACRLPKAKTIPNIMNVEGRVARIYWKQLSKIFDKKLNFITRQYANRPFGSVDPINTLLNYGYALLESECRKAINSVGLDTHVGFLHEVTLGKEPLVYDLQEPFRWVIDMAVINAIEKNLFNKKDFIRTENYNLKLRIGGAKKLTKEVEKLFRMKVDYTGKKYPLSYIIFLKTRELAHYLLGKRMDIDFKTNQKFKRDDDFEIRQKILKLSYSEAKRLGISKGGLWYMKQNAQSDKPFKIYGHVKEKLDTIS